MKNVVLAFVLICLGYACLPPEVEFINFRQNIMATPEPAFVTKSGFLQTRNENYVIIGSTRDSQLLITNTSPFGELRSNRIADPATGHDIIPIRNATDDYIILGNTSSDCFVQLTDSNGTVSGNRFFFRSVVNSQLGLVNYLKGYSIASYPDGSGYLITGRIRQALGGERLFVMKITAQLAFEKIRTFNTGLYGTSLIIAEDGTFAVAGISGNQVFMAVHNPDLSLVRQRLIPDVSAKHYVRIAQNDNREWLIPGASVNNSSQITLNVYSNDLTSRREIPLNTTISLFDFYAYSIVPVRDGGYLIAGSGKKIQDADEEAFIMKIGSDHAMQWIEFYPGSSTTIPIGIAQVKDYGFALVNFVSNGTTNDYQLIKTDERGKTR